MSIPFLTGQRLTADLLNANVTDYMPATYTKTALTARTSTVTLADDPDLSSIPLSVGTWEVEVVLHWTQTTTTTQKLKTRWAFTGTAATSFRDVIGAGSAQSGMSATNPPSNLTESSLYSPTTDTQDAIYQQREGGVYGSVRELCRTFVVTVAGNFSVQWAQAVSTANATTIQSGSTVTVRKIS